MRKMSLWCHTRPSCQFYRTVANLWRIERGNAEAKEIAEKAGEIYNQICLVAERLEQAGQYPFHRE